MPCSVSMQELQSRCIMTYCLPSSSGARGGPRKHQLMEQTQFLYPPQTFVTGSQFSATLGALGIQPVTMCICLVVGVSPAVDTPSLASVRFQTQLFSYFENNPDKVKDVPIIIEGVPEVGPEV